MAFYDDKRWLLKHIRHSFITGDESQLCEHVLLNNDFPLPKGLYDSDDDQVIIDEEVTSQVAESPDVFVGTALHRPRTYTAMRLEKMRKNREDCCGTKQVVWSQPNDEQVPDSELDEMFSKKAVAGVNKKSSKLTEMLMRAPEIPPNPFAKYAKFDGAHCYADVVAKRIRIFLTMLPAPEKDRPLDVSVIPTAKVSELIGLVCWQYISQRRSPPLPHDTVDSYKLLFAEEDGEYDCDFPALEKTEVISKFHFTSLALVEISETVSRDSLWTIRPRVAMAKVIILPSRDVVDVVLPNQGNGLTISDLLTLTEEQCTSERVVNRLKSKTFVVKEKADPTNTILSLNALVEDCRSREFILAPSETRAEEIRMRKHLNLMEAAFYQSFSVSLIHRMRTATEIHLGISGDKIEVNPVTSKVSALSGIFHGSSGVKPVTYNMDTIADCSIVDEKYGKKAVVRLVHRTRSGEFENLDFECNQLVARTIDQKCKHILNSLGSVARQEYLELDAGKKSGKRWFVDK